MPVYEFYCRVCHTVFSFISGRVRSQGSPACPACGLTPLERRVSQFAISAARPDKPDDGLPEGFDEQRLEQAMRTMASDLEHADENDPKAMAHLMRRLAETGGMPLGRELQEALHRLERGEDPEQIEQDLGDLLEGDGPLEQLFTNARAAALRQQRPLPLRDQRLYRWTDDHAA